MTADDDETAGARWAEDLLLELGEYAPLEMLIRSRRLGLADLEAWARGEATTLAACLRGNPERVGALLAGAERHCQRRGLTAHPDPALGDNPAPLARDATFAHRLGTRYRPPSERAQGDLFEDSAGTALSHQVVAALTGGACQEAEAAVERLAARVPDHPRLGAYQALVDGLVVPEPPEDPDRHLEWVLGVLEPAARSDLGPAATAGYLEPHWRTLATALAGRSLDPERPAHHASYAALRSGDWAAVETAVTAEPGWPRSPVLLRRLLRAARARGDSERAREVVCRLCWDCPEEAEAAVAADPEFGPAWASLIDLDWDPPPEITDLPAWWALRHGGGLPELLDAGTAALREQAVAATAVATTPPRTDDPAHQAARRRLQAADPRLLEAYLAGRW